MKVTIFMPVFNAEKYLKESIESILNQTYKDFEFLIINDGSTDKSKEVIKKYLEDKRVIYIENERNMGLPYTRNLALKLAQGEYIALMDADDISFINRIEEQVNYLDCNKEIVAIGANHYFFENNKNKKVNCIYDSEMIQIHLMFSNCICNPVSMFRNEFVKKHNITYRTECISGQDYAFWVDISKYGKISNLNKTLLKYRFGHDNITKKAVSNMSYQRIVSLGETRKRALLNNGFNLSEEEFKIYNEVLYDGINKVGLKELSEFNHLLSKMIKINKEINKFSNYKFKYIVQEIWSEVLIKSKIKSIDRIKLYLFKRFYKISNRDIKRFLRIIKRLIID